MTPSENNIDQKPDIQSMNNSDKAADISQPKSNADITDNSLKVEFKTNSKEKHSETQAKENLRLKRPALVTLDCEILTDDDCSMNQTLYDYSTWDAWYVY